MYFRPRHLVACGSAGRASSGRNTAPHKEEDCSVQPIVCYLFRGLVALPAAVYRGGPVLLGTLPAQH